MQDRIAIDAEIHFGKPCVAGTRIPVQSVLELIREGLGFDQITRDYYPDLQRATIYEPVSNMRWTFWPPKTSTSPLHDIIC